MHTALFIIVVLIAASSIGVLYCLVVYGKEMMGLIQVLAKNKRQEKTYRPERPDYF